MREKDEVLRALRKCGAVTLILTEGYYASCMSFSGKLRKHDILVECPNFGFTDDGMLKSLKWDSKKPSDKALKAADILQEMSTSVTVGGALRL